MTEVYGAIVVGLDRSYVAIHRGQLVIATTRLSRPRLVAEVDLMNVLEALYVEADLRDPQVAPIYGGRPHRKWKSLQYRLSSCRQLQFWRRSRMQAFDCHIWYADCDRLDKQ